MALDGGDPRLTDKEGEFGGQGIVAYTRPQMRKLHDPSISFEEYHHYALQTRAEEEAHYHSQPKAATRGFWSTIIPSKSSKGVDSPDGERHGSLIPNINLSDPDRRASVTDQEWTNASRAVRTATAGAVFYLITTDILGPFGLPYAFAATGWGCVLPHLRNPFAVVLKIAADLESHSIRYLALWLVFLAGCYGSALWV